MQPPLSALHPAAKRWHLELALADADEDHRSAIGFPCAFHLEGDTGWVIAEFGRHAGYVRNLEAHPDVRVRVKGHWRTARARIRDDDDAQARLDAFHRRSHEAAVRQFGTDLLTIEFDFSGAQ